MNVVRSKLFKIHLAFSEINEKEWKGRNILIFFRFISFFFKQHSLFLILVTHLSGMECEFISPKSKIFILFFRNLEKFVLLFSFLTFSILANFLPFQFDGINFLVGNVRCTAGLHLMGRITSFRFSKWTNLLVRYFLFR